MATALDAQIRTVVENFVNDLGELVRRAAVESVTIALGGDDDGHAAHRSESGRERKAGGAARRGRGRRKGEKRSAPEIEALQTRLLAAIKKTPGLRKEQLAEELRTTSKELMLVTNKLLEEGAVSKRGVKRATTYYAR